MPDPSNIPLARYRLSAVMRAGVRLPGYAGSLLRGQFGAALRQVACMTRQPTCAGCPLLNTCPYTRVFEAPPSPAHDLQKFSNIPNAYVMEPPLTTPELAPPDLRAGDPLVFHMVLAGAAIAQLPLIVFAWQRALAQGLTRDRAPADLHRVDWLDSDGAAHCIWEASAPTLLAHGATIMKPPDFSNLGVAESKALAVSNSLLGQRPGGQPNAPADQLALEAFEFTAQISPDLSAIAEWIATHALPDTSNSFFANKLKTDLVLLHDTDFAHFARHAMVVEPHVRINDDSGTADDGDLFYVENLPPETLMVGLAQASIERFKKGSKPESTLEAADVLAAVFAGEGDSLPGIGGKLLQIGGDATTGRGLVLVQSKAAHQT